MSKISTVYPAIIAEISTNFATKTRLSNPYDIFKNPDLIRKNAWGLKVNGAVREDEEFCNLSLARSFTFISLRQLVKLEGREDAFDTISVALLEDQQTFLNAFWAVDKIGQGSNIQKIDFEDISGINELVDGEKKYLFNEVTFTITINEAVQ